jgi:hypothetical protein
MPDQKVKPKLTQWENNRNEYLEALKGDSRERREELWLVFAQLIAYQREEIPRDLRPYMVEELPKDLRAQLEPENVSDGWTWPWFWDKENEHGNTSTQVILTLLTLLAKWDHERSSQTYGR